MLASALHGEHRLPVYTTCLFCSSSLGRNEAIEHFPVGRRLAYDADKGRLWIVCRHCERWNLTPLEERWEAIEDCERLYRATRLRVSTEHIGLARLSEGTEIIRIGRPQRPEIAAWRYGDQFGRRRQRRVLAMGTVAAAGGVALAGGLSAGIGVVTAWQVGRVLWKFAERGSPVAIVARIRDHHGDVYRIRRKDLVRSRITAGADGGLAIKVAYDNGRPTGGLLHLEGAVARQAAANLLPAVNRMGGTKDEVQQAVGRIERAGTADQFIREQAKRSEKLTRIVHAEDTGMFAKAGEIEWESGLHGLPTVAGLALEMALHEEQERRALEGELADLEQAWRDAEEVGAIADSLLLPAGVEAALAKLRARG